MAPIAHLLLRALAAQKSVFAHVVVGNTAAHDQVTWARDISLAAAAGVDAFVLNIAYPDSNIPKQVKNAFAAAEAHNGTFKLLFSFDYLGGGQPWPASGDNSVVSYLNQYKNSPAHFRYQGKPFVSTFEGVTNTQDWAYGGTIRSQVEDLYFVPDWTSLGPQGIKAHLDKIEGAFSWDMWPEGPTDMTIGNDKAWKDALGEKSYMMGCSPWFFRSAEGGKNWVWKGDDLWAHRWSQTLEVEPDFVQIVSWNDFGESHYIGPVHAPSEIAPGSAPYVESSPHDSWAAFLPYYISQFKGLPFQITKDQMQYWYRDSPAAAGLTGLVVGNNPSQGQPELNADDLVTDGIFFSALLMADAQVSVQIGDNPCKFYDGKKGLNHWNQLFAGQAGVPVFSVLRGGKVVVSKAGAKINQTTSLENGYTNYNAWVGSF